MSEYNWRREREKFRPEITKGNNADTAENIQVGMPEQRSSSAKIFCIIAGVVIIAVLAAAAIFIFKGDSSPFADVAEKYKTAVGLVTVTVEAKNGNKITAPVGTAWAFAENRFATNGHVANALSGTMLNIINSTVSEMLMIEAEKAGYKSVDEFLKAQGNNAQNVIAAATKMVIAQIADVRADIIINNSKKKSYSIAQVQIHKDYGVVGSEFQPDLAVLTIDGKHDNYFKLAGKSTLADLKSGVPIAFLGFPTERLNKGNFHIDDPIASMQCGTVVAVSDFDMKDAGVDGNFLLRHNLPATGGASGSPIFNQNGEVVAALCGGNVIGQVSANGQVVRAPSAVQINFGIRVDLLSGMNKAVPIKEILKF